MSDEAGPEREFKPTDWVEKVIHGQHLPLRFDEKPKLRYIIQAPVMIQLLGLAYSTLTRGNLDLLNIDLTGPSGVKEALQLQGAMHAFPRFLETLAALVADEPGVNEDDSTSAA
jgi:hypothetical protein